MRGRPRLAAIAAGSFVALAACTSGEAPPSTGAYTVTFPSTAAAVGTDTVQVFLFDFPPSARANECQDLIAKRRQRTLPAPVFENQPVNVCQMLNHGSPITVPYGEHAALAVGARQGADFLIGCVIETFGDGDAPVSIPLALYDVTAPVPATNCTSVSAFCARTCTAQ